jgi:hypothetical protein
LRKKPRYVLTLVDLLHASNFKGGNSSIIDPEGEVNRRLTRYSELLQVIEERIGEKALGRLTPKEKEWFKEIAQRFIELPHDNLTAIRGFRSSYASAVLSGHFPELAPVLDRNILLGAEIKHSTTKQGQVINIERYYAKLIDTLYARLSSKSSLSLRLLDEQLFVAGSGKR